MKPVLMVLASLVLLVIVFFSGVVVTAKFIADPEPHKLANVDAPDLWTSSPKKVDTTVQSYQRLPDATPVTESVAAKPVVAETTAGNQSQASLSGAREPVDNTVTAAIGQAQNDVRPMTTQPSTEPVPSGSNNLDTSAPPVNAAQAEWCFARYKSYRVQDNTYQPYDGSPRRQCQGAAGGPVMSVSQPSKPSAQNIAAAPPVQLPRYIQSHENMQPGPPQEIPYSDQDAQVYDGEPGYDAPQAVETGAGGSHEEWCTGRYRSYRADDNSYQPFEGGPRQQCQSPFG